jgi:mRNA interferase RelE/StbE
LPYQVEFKLSAGKAIQGLQKSVQRRILAKTEQLAADPRPPDSKKLKGSDFYRVRVGDYRIVYSVEDKVLLVLVVAVGHRRDIYRALP